MFPIAPPALRDGGIFLAPIAGLEGLQRLQARLGISGTVDGSQRRHDGFAILVGDELQRGPDQMDNAGLDDRLRKDGSDGFGKALQAVDHGDQDVLAATLFSSFITRSQNFAPSVCSIHSPRISLLPSARTASAT